MAAVLGFLLSLFLALLSSAASQSTCSTSQTFSNNRRYSACNALPHLSASVHYTFDPSASLLSLAFSAPPSSPSGWVAWALNPTPGGGMAGAQTLIAFRQPDGAMGVKTYNITGYGPLHESRILYETSDLAAEYSGGVMRIFGKLKLPKGVTTVSEVWQVGGKVDGGVPAVHAFGPENLAAKATVDLVSGASSGGGGDPRLKKKNIHGVLNAVSWGVLLPMGAIFARYLKTFKSADPAWFYLHVSCQVTGYAVGVAGWATGLNLGSKSKGITYTTHRNIGIALFALCTVQIFALFLRPDKDNKHRIYWNIYHHSVGYTVIVLGIINVFKGLDILDPAHKWKNAYIIVICILGGIALLLEVVTWIIVLRRKSGSSAKPYDGGANGLNGRHGVQRPLSV